MFTQPRRIEEIFAREVGLLLLLLILAFAQITLLPRLLGMVPALLLVIVIDWALVVGASIGLRWAFYGGVALDLCASTILGSHALALLLAVVAVLLLVRRIRGEHWLIPITGAFLGTLVYEAVLAAIYTWHGPALEWRTYAMIVLLPSALLATVPALPIYMLLRQIVRRIQDGAPER
jgi:rod shape-determining protein MreD